jgi:pilus assembly protein CpaF
MSARVFVVVGAKGGVGATSIALHLIEHLPAHGPRAIIDADLAGKRSISVWYNEIANLDLGRVPGMPAATTMANGLTIVELARTYEDAFLLTVPGVETVAGKLLASGALIVVDTPQPFAATVRPFISRATQIVVVTEPTLLGVSAARSMLSAMERFGIPNERIAFVINNPRDATELRRNEIQDALRTTVAAELPVKRDRGYDKALKQLTAALGAVPDRVELTALRQSTAKPLGDRRESYRAYPAAAPAASFSGITTKPVSVDDPEAEDLQLPPAAKPELEQLKTELHGTLLRRIDFLSAARAHTDALKLAELRKQVDAIADEFLATRKDVGSAEEASLIRAQVIEEALGLGPLESLLHDESITEIMVNGHGNVFVERRGRIERTAKRFVDDRQVRLVIERIIAPLGRRLDESSPMVDARLPDGSRVNAIIEPLSIDGPTLTIRRFGTKRFGINDLIDVNAITPPVVDFLRAAVEARLNCLVSGGTGSGKTTLLNALSSFIPKADRIVTIEDAAELKLDQPHVVRLESRPPNLEGKGAITIRDLVRNSLRMRPDRIVVGECRGGEALDMLQAMNTGHDGSMTTVHANTPRDAIARVETMVLMSGFDLPIRAIREQVAGAIDLIVQVARLRDGSRRVTSVSEVVGMEGDVVTMQELVRYQQHGLDPQGNVVGEFEPTGVQPTCLKRFEELGIEFDPVVFSPPVEPPARRAAASWLR